MQAETLVELILILGVFVAPLLWVWRYPLETALAVLAYLSVEELILNYVPDALYAPARLGPEVLLLVGAVSALLRTYGERGWKIRLFWPESALLAVLLLGAAVAVIRRVPPVFTVIGLRWLFRYLPLYLIWRLRGDSARLICPAPMPIVCRALARTIAFDFTPRTTFHATSHAARSTAVGFRCEARRQADVWSGSASAS